MLDVDSLLWDKITIICIKKCIGSIILHLKGYHSIEDLTIKKLVIFVTYFIIVVTKKYSGYGYSHTVITYSATPQYYWNLYWIISRYLKLAIHVHCKTYHFP